MLNQRVWMLVLITKLMTFECLLCVEETSFIGVGSCDHYPFCFRCIYKMRAISKNNQCPICKASLTKIIVTDTYMPYAQLQTHLLPDKQFADIFHHSAQAREAFQKLTQFKCWVKSHGKPCKSNKFPSMAFLKKHLKEDHNRYICEVCYDKKTCVLEQQKLYTYRQLDKHLNRGDVDEMGNLTFMHPYCKFCNRHFFDEDEFKMHINIEHMYCSICGKEHRYRYYQGYQSLEVHFKMSHYICPDPNCLAQKFIAFASPDQLQLHRAQVHDKNSKKVDMRQLCGFQYEGHDPNDRVVVIKDKEGVDMEDQFLTLKKTKNKALGQADMQEDQLLDPRQFLHSDMADDEHFEEAFVLRQRTAPPGGGGRQKKKKYVSKEEVQSTLQREKSSDSAMKREQVFYIEDLPMIFTLHLPKLSYEEVQSRIKGIIGSDDVAKLTVIRNKLLKKHVKPAEYLQEFLRVMRSVSLRSGYLVFPHVIRTFTSQDLKQMLDHEYLIALKKLPSRSDSIITRSQRYSHFFDGFIREVQQNIEERIKDKRLSLKKRIVRSKQQLFQMMGVLRRLKIHEMAKFKFAINFGVEPDTIEYIKHKIMTSPFNEMASRLDKIETEELLNVYVFIRFCGLVVKHSKDIRKQKNKIHQNILQDFLDERPYLQERYGPKKEEMKDLDQQIEFEKIEEERKVREKLRQLEKKSEQQGIKVQTDFNLKDKSDFPDLLQNTKGTKTTEQPKERLTEVIGIVKNKPATYKKKMNQMFPSLGEEESNSPTANPTKSEKKEVKKQQQKEKAWWQKINDKKPVFEQDEQSEVRVRKGRKKKQKWVSVKGIFN